ncbi:MAG: TrmH family RNA methyltransferase [Bacillota bacterium]
MDKITSIKNNKIKSLRKLYQKKYRKEKGQFILEGLRLSRGSYKAGADIDTIFLTRDYYNSIKNQPFIIDNQQKLVFVSKDLIEEVADTENPQEIITVVNKPNYDQKAVFSKEYILVLDRVQDPGNMGTIIRTAVAAGFQSIIITKGSVDIFNLKVLRSTVGAIYSIPFIKDVELNQLKSMLKDKKQNIYAADLNTDMYYNRLKYKTPLSLIIGNEARGIRAELLDLADQKVKIPIRGDIESLNAAVAAGLMMYEILRK